MSPILESLKPNIDGPIFHESEDSEKIGYGTLAVDAMVFAFICYTVVIISRDLPAYLPDFAIDAVLLCATIHAVRYGFVATRIFKLVNCKGIPAPYGEFSRFITRAVLGSFAALPLVWIAVLLGAAGIIPGTPPLSIRILAKLAFGVLPVLVLCIGIPLSIFNGLTDRRASPTFQFLYHTVSFPGSLVIYSLPYLFLLGGRHYPASEFSTGNGGFWIFATLWIATATLSAAILFKNYPVAKAMYNTPLDKLQ